MAEQWWTPKNRQSLLTRIRKLGVQINPPGFGSWVSKLIFVILASVAKTDVNLELLPEDIHLRIREILTGCLQKDLRERYRDTRVSQN
jgi:hypothetical protein